MSRVGLDARASTPDARGSAPYETIDALLARACASARVLPALVADNAVAERARLVAAIARGEPERPAWVWPRRRTEARAREVVDRARKLVAGTPAAELYLARLAELELDFELLDAIGEPRRVRPLAARRYGDGLTMVDAGDARAPVVEVATAMLASIDATHEPRTLAADAAPGRDSAAARLRIAAEAIGLAVDVRVEPRLAASAATGDRTIYLADRAFGERETRRLVAHEVLGHLVAAANGLAQPLGILSLGTAGSFVDQEGVSLWLEEASGALDGGRLRILAARVIATHRMHAGASFGDTALELVREHGFAPDDAVRTAERAFRGGGVARDEAYLVGWLRVRGALARSEISLDELRIGRVGLRDVATLRSLAREGLVLPPRYLPSFDRSRSTTVGGTSPDTSPPSITASLTRFDAT